MMLIAIAALAFACDKSNEPKPDDPAAKNGTTGATTTTATTTATPAPAPVTIADSDLSTPADFEEAAEKAITAKNYKAEISTLEKDIDKE